MPREIFRSRGKNIEREYFLSWSCFYFHANGAAPEPRDATLWIIGQLFHYEDVDTFNSTRMRMLQFVSVALLYNTMYVTYMCLRVTRITMLPLSNWSLLVLACNILWDKYDAKGIPNNFLAAYESIRILVENFYRYVLSHTVGNIWKLARTQATHIQWESKLNIRLEGTKLIQKYIC